MENDRHLLQAAADLVDAGEEFVLATVIRTRGSTPRDVGARMLIRRAPSDAASVPALTLGTIGGGQFERLVVDAAQACFEKKNPRTEEFVLGADADQCCGGVVEILLEYFGPRGRLIIFGAGHVAHELAALLNPSPLQVTIADDRPEWNSPERFPAAERLTQWSDAVALARLHHATTLALVMTCSHDTDFALLRQLLAPDAPGAMPALVGLIGSRSKRICLFGRLVAAGIDEAIVQRIRCPIGVGDTGKTPRAVAISVAAQVLIEARTLAAVAR